MTKPANLGNSSRTSLAGVFIALAVLPMAMGLISPVAGAPKISASGGGTISGSPGLAFTGSASQFGFYADSGGGRFECAMAGFSGGFGIPGTPFAQVLLMQVRGSIDSGSLTVARYDGYIHGVPVSGTRATFTGTSTVTIVGTAADGSVASVVMELHYSVEVIAGGAGEGLLHLDHPEAELHTGGLLASGRIVAQG